MSGAGGFCTLPTAAENDRIPSMAEVEGMSATTTRKRWLATLRGSALLLALAALMVLLTGLGAVVLQRAG
ncbi:MAG: hypothetical protein JWL78_597 [Chloroflexi bacterium]|jgi:hypothetical protein|nr:hypothetical protein [Chloroflexota bacterium]